MKKSFTLAEIMIALTIIGIITAILLPVAQNCTPSGKVMKFKKANATLYRVINELVTSGEYYTPGDLGVKPDGTLIDSATYLCETIADVLSVKNKNCYNESVSEASGFEDSKNKDTISTALDAYCRYAAPIVMEELKTYDNIVYYQTDPTIHFGYIPPEHSYRLFSKINNNEFGFDRVYKIFCVDIDGIPNTATVSNCIDECPFGYGIRADGKIILGARAQAWLEKSIQDKE